MENNLQYRLDIAKKFCDNIQDIKYTLHDYYYDYKVVLYREVENSKYKTNKGNFKYSIIPGSIVKNTGSEIQAKLIADGTLVKYGNMLIAKKLSIPLAIGRVMQAISQKSSPSVNLNRSFPIMKMYEEVNKGMKANENIFETEQVAKDKYVTQGGVLQVNDRELTDAILQLVSSISKSKTSEIKEDTQYKDNIKQENYEYTSDNFNKDIFGKVNYKKDIEPLLYNKSSILALTGSVGTGKSTIAKHIGWAIVGYKESYRMEMINFNASLDYCDLYIGTKPMPGKPGALEERPGAIKQLCDRALAEPKKEFVLIMDEFNRGNISNIGGPLISCLADRGTPYKLDSKHELCIPENVQVIITMNTSDQSISSLDRALLDRMNPIDLNEGKFRELFKPTYDDLVQLKLFTENQHTELKRLIELVDILNDILEKDETFGSDNRISFRPIMNYVNSNSHNLDQSLNQIKLALKYLRWSIEEHIYRDAVAKFSDYIQKYKLQ